MAQSAAPQITADTIMSSKAGSNASQLMDERSATKMNVRPEKTANIQIPWKREYRERPYRNAILEAGLRKTISSVPPLRSSSKSQAA